jgi:DNA-binding response OmpR family regulator
MTHQTTPSILIVDDDECICKTLSAIIQAEGYQTETATTAKEAIEKTKTKFFNLTLLDIKLPDMKGTRLLAQLQKTTPRTIKIMITGYPSIQNAVQALNLGADSYIMKPINPAELLKTIRNKLKAQQQAEKTNKEKLAKWIQSQARQKHSSNFQEFLEETASELVDFGITKTQAKIYATIVALGVASASEIAALSKIRREEVYRIIPKLEKHGLVIRKLKKPRKFSAIQPEKAIQFLTKTKLKTMKEEIDKLEQKQVQLISKLKTVELPIWSNSPTIDIISKQDNVTMKLMEMAKNAKQKIDALSSFEGLKIAYISHPKKLREELLKKVKMRIITKNHELDAFTKEILKLSEANNNPIELRQIEKLPFNLLIVDDKEAIWGELQTKNENPQNLWTNDPTQIAILKMSFENLWQKSSRIRKLKHD